MSQYVIRVSKNEFGDFRQHRRLDTVEDVKRFLNYSHGVSVKIKHEATNVRLTVTGTDTQIASVRALYND